MNERPIPPQAIDDENSVELLRAWVANRQLFCSLKVGMYQEMGIDEPNAWGIVLADAARHIVMALETRYGLSRDESLAKVKTRFIAELTSPTSGASGVFVDSTN